MTFKDVLSEAACLESPEKSLMKGRDVGDRAVEWVGRAGP